MTTEQLKAWLLEYMPLKLETENRREHLKRLKACAELPPAREYDGSQHTRSSGEDVYKRQVLGFTPPKYSAVQMSSHSLTVMRSGCI